MKENTYAEQTAKLVETSFDTMGDALKEIGPARTALTAKAQLQMAAAQVIATLNLAAETRIASFIQVARVDAAGGEKVAPEVAREAFLIAAVALGLVEDPDAQSMTREQLEEALGLNGGDLADGDLGDLK